MEEIILQTYKAGMTFFDIDWRISSTARMLREIEKTVIEVESKLENEKEEYLIEDGVLFMENLLGIAFIVAQTYITGVIADAKVVTMRSERFTKDYLLKAFSERVDNNSITRIEVCDAMANYYKHHEEWHDWKKPGRNRKTISILNAIGIDQYDEIPFDKVMGILWPGKETHNLESLIELLSTWRIAVIAASKMQNKYAQPGAATDAATGGSAPPV